MQSGTTNPKVETLAMMVGEWAVEATHPALRDTVARGTTTYEWLEGRQFLIQRTRLDHPDVPDSVSVIGAPGGDLMMHYFDSRGVYRLYDLSFADGVLTIWREAPGFSQHYTGTVADGGHRVDGLWTLSRDGSTWTDDLRINYRRVDAARPRQS